jgi:ABC-type lipoprotein export system ATPase subunit
MSMTAAQSKSPASPANAPPILRAQHIKRTFRMGESHVDVLTNVDLTLRPGEFVAIEGRSGSGKSTLLHILAALDGVDSGSVALDDRDYTQLTFESKKQLWPGVLAKVYDGLGSFKNWLSDLRFRYQLLICLAILASLWGLFLTTAIATEIFKSGKGWFVTIPSPMAPIIVLLLVQFLLWIFQSMVLFLGSVSNAIMHRSVGSNEGLASQFRNTEFGFVFQFYHLLPELDVLENTLLGPMVTYSVFGYLRRRRALRRRAHEVLEQLGMAHRLTHRPNQLSGGERQRVAIARALMNSPRILFADEPTGNLDAETGRQIMDLLEKLHRDQGQTIVMVTHDRALAREADRVLVLKNGQLQRAQE